MALLPLSLELSGPNKKIFDIQKKFFFISGHGP